MAMEIQVAVILKIGGSMVLQKNGILLHHYMESQP